MVDKNTVNAAWITDTSGRWLRLPIAALRRNQALGVVSAESKEGRGFVYLDPDSAVRALTALEENDVDVRMSEAAGRFARRSEVRNMPPFVAMAA